MTDRDTSRPPAQTHKWAQKLVNEALLAEDARAAECVGLTLLL